MSVFGVCAGNDVFNVGEGVGGTLSENEVSADDDDDEELVSLLPICGSRLTLIGLLLPVVNILLYETSVVDMFRFLISIKKAKNCKTKTIKKIRKNLLQYFFNVQTQKMNQRLTLNTS